MVPAQPSTWACAWKLSTDFSSFPKSAKGWLRFHAGMEGWWNSHNSSCDVSSGERGQQYLCASCACEVQWSLLLLLQSLLPGWITGEVGGQHPLGWFGLGCELLKAHLLWDMGLCDMGSKADVEQATDVDWCSCLPLRKESQIKGYEDDCSGLTNALGVPCHRPYSCSMWLAGVICLSQDVSPWIEQDMVLLCWAWIFP